MRLLLVDDSDALRVMVRRAVESAGFTVVGEGRDGIQALDLLKVGSDRVDLVVLDGRMPRMDGVAATREIRCRYPDIAIVGYTSDPMAGESMVENGALAYVLKGASASELVGMISSVGGDTDGQDARDAEPYLALAETLWRAPASDIAATACITGGPMDTDLVTDVLALKMVAVDDARENGEREALVKVARSLARVPAPRIDEIVRLSSSLVDRDDAH